MTSQPADHLPLRQLTGSDFGQVHELCEIVFNSEPVSATERAIDEELLEVDRGRAVGVFDAAELVGVGTLSSMEMTVPGGGVVPLAAVTLIGVKPTHRRRGIMSDVIGHQLRAVHESGREALAGLTASESVIYGRFGYGRASYGAWFAIPRHRSELRPVPGTEQVRVRLVPTQESVPLCEAIHARQVGKRPGMLVRPESWGRARAADVDTWRRGRSALRTAVALRGEEAVGYARYRTRDEWTDSVASGDTDVEEIHADDTAAFAALIRYLLGIDLTGGAKFYRQPVDSPLVYLLADLRAADMRVREVMYLRLVDVDRALAARTYAGPVDLVVQITDELCPWNAGRWRLTGDEKTAQCIRTSASADLALDVRELAAAYLGGTSLAALEQAALVTERRPGAVAEASRAFATPLAPWLQFGI